MNQEPVFPVDNPDYDAVFAQERAMVDASELIARALEASGMSRADLARRLGVSRGEITNRLTGERNITVRKLAATLHACGEQLELSATRRHAPRRPYGRGWTLQDRSEPRRPSVHGWILEEASRG